MAALYNFQSSTIQSKKGGKDQESIQSSTTPDPQLDITNESQVSPFSAGDHKASIKDSHESIAKTKHYRKNINLCSTKEAPPWNGQ